MKGSLKLLIAVYTVLGALSAVLRLTLFTPQNLVTFEGACLITTLIGGIIIAAVLIYDVIDEYTWTNLIGICFIVTPFTTLVVWICYGLYKGIVAIGKQAGEWADKHLDI